MSTEEPEDAIRVVYGHPLIELHEGRLEGALVRIAMLTEDGADDPEARDRFTAALEAEPEPGREFAPIEEQDLSGPRPWAAALVFDDTAVRSAERLVEAVTGTDPLAESAGPPPGPDRADTASAVPSQGPSTAVPPAAATPGAPSTVASQGTPWPPNPPAAPRPSPRPRSQRGSRVLGALAVAALLGGAAGGTLLAESHNAADRERVEAERAQRRAEESERRATTYDASDEVPEAPFRDPLPKPEEAEFVGAEPVGVVGPVFGDDEALEVRTTLDLPFAFRLPDEGWTCVSGTDPGEIRRWCLNEESEEWSERVRIVWRLCPDDCPDDTAAAMETDWIDPWLSEESIGEITLEPFDDATAFAEVSAVGDDGEDLYVLVVSHFFETEFGPAHVGVITDGHASSTETLQKIANDVRTQAAASADDGS